MKTVTAAVADLEAWLETMRGPDGYCGPVAHWWGQCLLFCGAGLDWRYEGIIDGYLTLWRRTGQSVWLQKACRAGNDIVQGQLPSGNFGNSSFELNPCTGGTPHEAACDVGLLLLAKALKETDEQGQELPAGSHTWQHYADCAERNLCSYYLTVLWDSEARLFRDHPTVPSFVPNKVATACEALFLLAEIRSDDSWIHRYVLPNLDRIIAHQARLEDSLAGAIAQNSLGKAVVEKYFPKYIARCVPALMQGYRWSGNERYADCALQAMRFIARWTYDDGSLPTVIYPDARVNRYPSWIAPLADVLRAAKLVRAVGFDADFLPIEQRLLAGQDVSGGVQTAEGFAGQTNGNPSALPDVRDVLHVVGWCDKVFRYWASQTSDLTAPESATRMLELDCVFHGKTVRYQETDSMIEVAHDGKPLYKWHKGQDWPAIASKEFWLQ